MSGSIKQLPPAEALATNATSVLQSDETPIRVGETAIQSRAIRIRDNETPLNSDATRTEQDDTNAEKNTEPTEDVLRRIEGDWMSVGQRVAPSEVAKLLGEAPLCGKVGCECIIKHTRKPRILLMGQRQ